jgi:anaerobic magnesium-protoporphyrin IX monomethyl ester cyclase
MKIAFIYPRYRWPEYNGLAEPLGILTLAAIMRNKGYDIDFIDYTLFPNLDGPRERIARADLCALSCSAALFPKTKEVLAYAKSVNPNALFILGGPHASQNPEVALRAGFDYAFLCEADHTFPAFVESWSRSREEAEKTPGIAFFRDGVFTRNELLPPYENISEFPHAARDLVDYDTYERITEGTFEYGMMSSRGCPHKCIICYPTLDILFRGHREREAADVASEVIELVKARGEDIRIYFKDDMLTLHPTEWFEEIGRLFDEAGVHPRWHCNARVDSIDKEMLVAMKKAGCTCISFGVESGSPKILEFYRKEITLDQSRQAFKWCHQLGIEVTSNICLGAPMETREDLEATYRFVKEIKPDDVAVYILTASPGKDIYNIAVEKGFLADNITSESYDAFDFSRARDLEQTNIKLDHLQYRDLIEYKRKILRWRSLHKMTSPRNIANWIGDALRHPWVAAGKAFRILGNLTGKKGLNVVDRRAQACYDHTEIAS